MSTLRETHKILCPKQMEWAGEMVTISASSWDVIANLDLLDLRGPRGSSWEPQAGERAMLAGSLLKASPLKLVLAVNLCEQCGARDFEPGVTQGRLAAEGE